MMYTEIFKKLLEIFEYQAFELYSMPNLGEFYIPYMMNDQMESYLVLKNCRMTGEYLPDFEGETKGRILETEKGYGLVVNQGEDNTFTLWFEKIRQVTEFYRYHEIGHFWVKGQEQWRRLVYIIGTIYDKFEYLGEGACNERELELLPLMEFAPFRYWSPIHEDLNGRYLDSKEGISCMEKLAREAKDTSYERLVRLYGRMPTVFFGKFLAKQLLQSKREGLYRLLCQKVKAASEGYPARDYGAVMNKQIQDQRNTVQKNLRKKGYTGSYPEFHKGNRLVEAFEEHPFTILEAENYPFRIQFLVSECLKGKGRRYRIEENEINL